MTAAPIGVGVLGCADIAWRAMLPAMKRVDGLRVTAVASRDAHKAARFAAEFDAEPERGYEELLARRDVDAVYVPLPTGLHAEWARAALNAGKHVLVEKPLAADAAGARSVTALAASTGLVVEESFMFLHHRQHAVVAACVAGGGIGAVREFEAVFGIPPLPADDIRNNPALGGGALLDLGVYPLRATRLFLGEDLRLGGASLSMEGDLDVAGAATLSTPDGRLARLGWGMRHDYRSTCTLWGSKGRITVERPFTLRAGMTPTVTLRTAAGEVAVAVPADDHFRNIAAHFEALVRGGGGEPSVRHHQIVAQAELVDEIRRLACRGLS